MSERVCCKVGCHEPAIMTMTYDYEESMAIVGPLVGERQAQAFDLCARHGEKLVLPVGWQLIRHSVV